MKVTKQGSNIVITVKLEDVADCGIENILTLYALATEEEKAFDWYADAKNFAKQLSVKYQISIVKVAKVIAALSPRQRWETNKKMAELCIASWSSNLERPKVHVFSAMSNTAYAILDEKPFNLGPKVANFAANILGYDALVTVDSLAISIPLGLYEYAGSYKFKQPVYQFVESLYIHAAQVVGVSPSKMQAITWVVCRRLKAENKSKFNVLDAYNAVGTTRKDIVTWLCEQS